MNLIGAISFAVILAATSSCKTRNQTSDSAVKDIGVVNTGNARTLVLYEDQGNVYLKACKPPLAPPLTRNCPSDETPKFLSLDLYLSQLPFDVAPYQRNQQGLSLVTKALQDARNAVAGGNQNAASTVARLEPIKRNLELLLNVSNDLTAQQQDLTYYEYHDEFSKLLIPFGDTGGGGGVPVAGMRFMSVEGRSFEMQETEVTRGQWKSVVGRYPEDLPGWDGCSFKEKTVFEDSHPVSCVAWSDANDFARRMTDKSDGYTYRLPSEEEWAYAAGNIEGATYGHCAASSTQRVGALKAHNRLYDMVGNVHEWTSTLLAGSYHVIRGGSWYYTVRSCRSAYASSWGPDGRYSGIGFRLLRMKP